MKRKYRRWLVALAALAVVASSCGDDGGNADPTTTQAGPAGTQPNTASDTGVTATEIKIAIHSADLSGLIKAGAIKGVPEDAHIENPKRISYYLDEWNKAGGINGRKFVYELQHWDPADPKTWTTSCQKIIEGKYFMVIAAGGGFPADTLPCITNEGKTQYISLDSLSASQYKGAAGNLIGMAPPGAATAQAGVAALLSNTTLNLKGSKVAVLRGDFEFQTDAFNEADKALKAGGVTPVFSEAIKIANLPAADQIKNVNLAVEKVKAAGADTVINMIQFTAFTGFPVEATKSGLKLRYAFIETSSGMCQTFTASQLPQELDGAPCVTGWNNFRWDTGGNKATDTPAEAQCRKEYETIYVGKPIGKGDFANKIYDKSNPGVSYPGITDGTGKYVNMDQSYYECAMMGFVKVGIEGAGGNLTKKTFQEAIFKKKEFEAPGLAGGKGTIEPNKPWLTSSLQQVVVTTNPQGFTGGPDAKGLYQGRCPSPLGCWRIVPNSVTPLTYKLS